MKLKFSNIKTKAAERERQQRSAARCKAIGISGPDDPALRDKFPAYASPAKRGRIATNAELAQITRDFIRELAREFGPPQSSAGRSLQLVTPRRAFPN